MLSHPTEEVQELPKIYTVPSGRIVLAVLSLIGAGGLVLIALGGFFFAILADVGMLNLHLSTTVPILLAIGLFAAGLRTLRAPREIHLTDNGVELHGTGAPRILPWTLIAFSNMGQTLMGYQRQLVLFGTDARPLVKISSNFGQFDDLVQTINARLAAAPSPSQSHAKLKRARKIGIGLIIGGLLAFALGGANFWMVRSDQEAQRLLKEQGAPAVATITEKLVAPDGHTHRIHYRVDDPSGKSDTANVQVATLPWQSLEVGQKINVVAVPGRPDISHFPAQIDDGIKTNPSTFLLMIIAIFGLGAFFFVVGILSYRGIDIDIDPKTGIRIQRIKIDAPPSA